jgi:purine-nucleoside phosphorylase
MGGLGDRLTERYSLRGETGFDEIDGVGGCTVRGHRGTVCLGEAAGRPFALVLGRRHFYEGGSSGMASLMEWLAQRGIGEVVAISAAGSVRAAVRAGELVVITEIIDLQNRRETGRGWRKGRGGAADAVATPERSAATTRFGPSHRLRASLEAAARRAGVALQRGVLACGARPAYETPAEIRALQEMGADVATMSAAPEVEFAGELGMEIAIVAAITNPGTGIGAEPPDHGRVLEEASAMCGALGDVLVELLVNK